MTTKTVHTRAAWDLIQRDKLVNSEKVTLLALAHLLDNATANHPVPKLEDITVTANIPEFTVVRALNEMTRRAMVMRTTHQHGNNKSFAWNILVGLVPSDEELANPPAGNYADEI